MMILLVSFRDWKQQGFKIVCKGIEKMKNKRMEPILSNKINFFFLYFVSFHYCLCYKSIRKAS